METTNNGSALSPVTPRRVVGRAAETNPLIAAMSQINEMTLDDVAAEIKLTENYLAGLKAMYQVGNIALGRAPDHKPAPAAQTVQAVPPKPPTAAPAPALSPTPAPPDPPAAAPAPTGLPPATGSLRGAIMAMLDAAPNLPTNEIIDRVIAMGLSTSRSSIQSSVYSVKALIRKKTEPAQQTQSAAARVTTPPTVASAGSKGEGEGDDEENEEDNYEGDDEGDDEEDNYAEAASRPAAVADTPLPAKESPDRAAAEEFLRRRVAEFVFRRGLASSRDVVLHCKVPADEVAAFLTHPWFEAHMGSWRLTKAGKAEGLADW